MANEDKTVISVAQTARPGTTVAATIEALLVLLQPASLGLGRRFVLSRDENWVGRSTDADLSIDSDGVSRRHARILRTTGGWYLEDAASTNGTFLNQLPVVGAKRLQDGDLVRFGDVILKFFAGVNVEAAYHEEIYQRSVLDGLTQVHNRRFFEDFLARELSRRNRHGNALALIMMDIDHFKRINDTYGHPTGDIVLKALARRLTERLRREDLLARYGGEEFVCVLTETPRHGAAELAEALRRVVELESIPCGPAPVQVTISLGVSATDDRARVAAETLIEEADQRLYTAKQSGRNRVVG